MKTMEHGTLKSCAAAACVIAFGCAAPVKKAGPPALCSMERGALDGTPGASTWLALILRGFDRATRLVTTPALDCTGAQVRWEVPAFACDDGALARTMLPERPLTAEDVIATAVPGGLTLVWIVTNHFASGDALGPVALVQTTPTAYEVVAIGALRANPYRAQLRVEVMGDRSVIVAEGEQCATSGSKCTRSARVVALRGDRFTPLPLVNDEGQCVSAAWFDIQRREQRKGARGWERVDLGTTLGFGSQGLNVDELLVVHDLGATPGASPDHVLHRAQGSRTVRWIGDRLVTTGRSLWAQFSAR